MDGGSSDESSDKEMYKFLLEDDDSQFMNGMLLFALHHDKYCNRLSIGNH
jgi:hypothetical protein